MASSNDSDVSVEVDRIADGVAIPTDLILAYGTGPVASPGPAAWCKGDLSEVLRHMPLDPETPVVIPIEQPDGSTQIALLRSVSIQKPTSQRASGEVHLHAVVLGDSSSVRLQPPESDLQ